MWNITNINTVPPDGWTFLVKENGTTLIALSEGALIQKIKSHYRANNIPIGTNLIGQIHNQICQRHPEYKYCSNAEKIQKRQTEIVTAAQEGKSGKCRSCGGGRNR